VVETVASILQRSLEQLATEVPAGYRRFTEALSGLAVEITASEPPFSIGGTGPPLVRLDVPSDVDVRVETDRATIVDVIDGRLTLHAAIIGGRIGVTGTLEDVVRAHAALLAYANAAVRSSSVPSLMMELRRNERSEPR
jgi:hypothetical protein